MNPVPPQVARVYALQSKCVPATEGRPLINGYFTWSEALAYDHSRRGGRVEVDWEPDNSFVESETDIENARAWSLREFPER